MARRKIASVFLFCVMSSLVQIGWGLDCYKCNSVHDNDCDKKVIQTCPPTIEGPEYCTRFTFELENKVITQKDCAPFKDCDKVLEILKSLYSIEKLKSCDFCTKNLCNSATNVKITLTSFIAMLTSAYMFLK